MDKNPFLYGNLVEPADFLDHRRPLRRVKGRLLSCGQSTAVVGEPRSGKTTLLTYLAAEETRTELYGADGEKMIFLFVDIDMLGGEFKPADFWAQALEPVKLALVDPEPESLLSRQFDVCRRNQFGTSTLEALFRTLRDMDRRLVLLIDEFDRLLHHPVLNSAEFYGGLRSLASRSRGALAVVIASRLNLEQLNSRAQEILPTGSPFFNIFAEITLGPFPSEYVGKLLQRAGRRFAPADRHAVRAVAGAHPFLLQAAAAAMWDASDEGLDDPAARYLFMGRRIYRELKSHFDTIWRYWSPAKRKAFTTVALSHVEQLVPEREFLTERFRKSLRDYGRELDDLEVLGHVARDEAVPGGFRTTAHSMLWWLTDELVRSVRDDTSFTEWLRAQELEFLLTREEQQGLKKVIRGAAQVLQQGAKSLVESFAKGLGEAAAKGG